MNRARVLWSGALLKLGDRAAAREALAPLARTLDGRIRTFRGCPSTGGSSRSSGPSRAKPPLNLRDRLQHRAAVLDLDLEVTLLALNLAMSSGPCFATVRATAS